MSTLSLAQALARRSRPDQSPGSPLITWYDDADGARVELSVTTYANWVAKTAGVLTDELDLSQGDTVNLDLTGHWLAPVFVGAAWLTGLRLAGGLARDSLGAVELQVSAHLDRPGDRVLFCPPGPFAMPSRQELPPGMLDFAELWPGQPDAYLGVAAPGTSRALLDDRTQGELLGSPTDDRVATDLDVTTGTGLELFCAVLAGCGSLVLVAHPDESRWQHHVETERATRVVRHE